MICDATELLHPSFLQTSSLILPLRIENSVRYSGRRSSPIEHTTQAQRDTREEYWRAKIPLKQRIGGGCNTAVSICHKINKSRYRIPLVGGTFLISLLTYGRTDGNFFDQESNPRRQCDWLHRHRQRQEYAKLSSP